MDEHGGAKTGTFYDNIEANVKPEYQQKVINIFRAPQNFFKHADVDPDKVLEFLLAQPEMFLACGVEKYVELAAERTAEMIVYMLWFSHQNPDMLMPEAAARMRQSPFPTVYNARERRKFFEDYIQTAAFFLANWQPK